MGFLKPPKMEVPQQPSPPPPFITQPAPTRKKSTVPTFLGAEKTPSADVGGGMERGKTLLGQ